MNFEQVLASALALTPLEQVRLIEEIMESLKSHLKQDTPQAQQSKQALYDVWQDINSSAEDIDELRRGTWEGFGNASLHSRSDASEGTEFPAADDDIG